MESIVSYNPEASEHQDSDCESDPGPCPTGSEPDKFCQEIAYESDTAVFDNTTSRSAGQQIHYDGAGQVMRDVDSVEHEYSNQCDDLWAPFNSGRGFRLAS